MPPAGSAKLLYALQRIVCEQQAAAQHIAKSGDSCVMTTWPESKLQLS
jgi:hypothetical protein